MPKRMLIDATHREETRVVVLDGNKVEEFDFEAASKRPLKGNIYLAKVTRVEPSLQAAFVEYGGNRQGFLAFAEIHPDYYQIPIADRMALIAEQEAEARRRSDDDIEAVETASGPAQESAADAAASSLDAPQYDGLIHDEVSESETTAASSEPGPPNDRPEPLLETGNTTHETSDPQALIPDHTELAEPAAISPPVQAQVQTQRPSQRWSRKRHYKIQEVIKRRQVILVQVVKEERGNKGAALTTYLSLAGRYCVLMPNTPRGGGISRKITNAADRTRLKSAAQALELPEGMGVIIRTAGENRSKAEIKRDYEYLLRMWDTIRELTLRSNAPACVYEEGDLIKRSIRDLYNKDVSEVIVEGDEGYRNAKDFMRMLMPSHAKNIKPYKEPAPLFQRYQIEAQLDAMFMPTVTLKSGGYIVINQTEALVSIDVNSGKATREHSIEETAYKTNLEAAEEIGRQLRLRDLAGLIVIDFIDMEDQRNDRTVEKRLRDCVKTDRARVQIGKISQFGLLEMSRQRLRAGVVAGSTVPCPHCGGQGIVRSVESTALRLLRALEEEAQRHRASTLGVKAPTEVAIYALNLKRREIARIESDYGLAIQFEARDGMLAGTFEIDRIGHAIPEDRSRQAASERITSSPETVVTESAAGEPEAEKLVDVQAAPSGSKRRRRRRRGRDRGTPPASPISTADPKNGEATRALEYFEAPPKAASATDGGRPTAETGHEQSPARKKRRRRRGRRSSQDNAGANAQASNANHHAGTFESAHPGSGDADDRDAAPVDSVVVPNAPSEPVWSLSPDHKQDLAPFERKETTQQDSSLSAEHVQSSGARSSTFAEPERSAEPPRKGWWQRPFRARE